jgi:GNAT superfamily N-acetyltransferase
VPPPPEDYRIQGLDADNDLAKINVCLWKGFNHGDNVDEDLSGRRLMQQAPNWKPELNIVAVAPDGCFAAYAGTWYDPALNCCFIEPVATVPEFRRMGLGRAAVMEGVRRCAAQGATKAFVGSDQPFYRSMGFIPVSARGPWFKTW